MADFGVPTTGWQYLTAVHGLTAGSLVRSGDSDGESFEAALDNDRLVVADRMREIISWGLEMGTTSTSYVELGKWSVQTSDIQSDDIEIAAQLHDNGVGTATLRVTIDDGTTTAQTTVATASLTYTVVSSTWTPGSPLVDDGELLITLELKTSSGGSASVKGVGLYEGDLASADLPA